MHKLIALGVALAASLAFAALAAPGRAAQLGPGRGAEATSDPDPADCVFCGGNPKVHIARMRALFAVQVDGLARAWTARGTRNR